MTTTTAERRGRLSGATCIATVRPTPAGDIVLEPGDGGTSLYGPVEIAWYADHLRITALGAGPSSIAEAYPGDDGEDVIVEIRLPRLEELPEIVPGAD